ncbi:single-stranded DNA-binding protein [Paenibacillus sp. GXUN7292]|uniref:single-stranded DNA-binding protein n=1 Tax=Paenibacillus sp. GXUN7292 TaxID=3422499 RepID=UPI003D7EBE84
MTAFLNRWTGIGNAVDDPYGGNMDSGSQWAYFKIACDRPFMSDDGVKADFIPVMCSGDVANQVLQYLKRGRFIYVEGGLRLKNYEGEWRIEVEADFIRMLDQPGQASSNHQQQPQRQYDNRNRQRGQQYTRTQPQHEPPVERPQQRESRYSNSPAPGRTTAGRSSGDRRTSRYDGYMPRR